MWDLTSWREYWTLRFDMFKTLLLEAVKWIRKERLDFEDQFRDYDVENNKAFLVV